MHDKKEEDFSPPFDVSFAEEIVRSQAAKHLPEPRMECSVSTIWNEAHSGKGKYVKGFTVRLERDLSRIDVDIDFGNMPINRREAERGLRIAIKQFPEAAKKMMEGRQNITMHAVTAGLIAISKNRSGEGQWQSVRELLEYPYLRRSYVRLTPVGIEPRIESDKLQWRMPDRANEVMRMPGKRIIPPDFDLGNGVRMTNDRIHIPQKIPETILTSHKGKSLMSLISIPGFENVPHKITDWRKWGTGIHISLSSPTLKTEDAFELMKRVIEAREK